MPVPEDMRRTVAVKLRLAPEAAAALARITSGARSAWVSTLILRAARRLRGDPATSQPQTPTPIQKG